MMISVIYKLKGSAQAGHFDYIGQLIQILSEYTADPFLCLRVRLPCAAFKKQRYLRAKDSMSACAGQLFYNCQLGLLPHLKGCEFIAASVG